MSKFIETTKSRSPKVEAFAREYLVDLNATAAALRAGYAPAHAGSQAGRLMRDPRIKADIAAAMAERTERIKVNADWVLQELVSVYNAARTKDDLRRALAALDKIGRHVNVHAFEDRQVVETMDHTQLIERINRGRERLVVLRQQQALANQPAHTDAAKSAQEAV